MVKISDKLLSIKQNRLIKARQKYDWLKEELIGVEYNLNLKKQDELDKFVVNANKTLAKSAKLLDAENAAFELCESKIKKFDVKAYMGHRAVNHATAKAIFKALAKDGDIGAILEKHATAVEGIRVKRENFVAKARADLDVTLKSISGDNREALLSEYDGLKQQLLADYEAFEAELTQKTADKLSDKKQRLNEKLQKAAGKIEKIESTINSNIQLPPDVLLRIENLKMYFGGLKAVDDLTFDVKKGEIFGLIGPNGAGKTTVFNCITRFYDATGGNVYFSNKYNEVVDMRRFKVHDVILQGISRTFQNIELVKEISVIENLLVASTRVYRSNIFVNALGLPLLKKEEKLLRQKAMRILKFMGIDAYANWLAFGLPYGILKKVEIARALMADPKLIIMDEPAAGLNEVETAELTETIRKIRDEFNTTILLVEHDMKLVMSVCDTVCAISFGKMLAIGTTQEIKQNKDVQEAYLGVDEEDS